MTPHNMLGVHGSHSPKALARCAHLPSLRVERGRKGPQHPQSLLYDTPPLLLHVSYGVPHFGKNQLLGGSMSLSPLWATQVNDLHVSMTFGPPSVFQPTSTKSPKDRHLSGPKSGAPPPQLAVAQQEGGGAMHTHVPPVAFAARSGFHTQTLAPYLDSLVRVSRRAIVVRESRGVGDRVVSLDLARNADWIPNRTHVTPHFPTTLK